MRQDEAERRRWLKRTTHPQFPQVTHHDVILPTDQQVLAKLHEHWTQTWSKAKQTPSSCKTQTLLENLPQQPERSGRPTEEELLTTWRRLRGAPGPDDWTASEIRALPEAAIACFGQVTFQWERLGTIPDALTFSRQVHLPKDSKVVRGKVEVKHLRPINVYSLWYRLWSSTWARSQLIKTWRCETLPSAISGGPGSPGTEVLASQCADALHSMGWLATVDYSLAFDFIDAEAVTQAMRQLGMPAGLAQVLCEQWTNQKRVLQWRRSTLPTTLRTDIAVPQGDAMSPLALNICMRAQAKGWMELLIPLGDDSDDATMVRVLLSSSALRSRLDSGCKLRLKAKARRQRARARKLLRTLILRDLLAWPFGLMLRARARKLVAKARAMGVAMRLCLPLQLVPIDGSVMVGRRSNGSFGLETSTSTR